MHQDCECNEFEDFDYPPQVGFPAPVFEGLKSYHRQTAGENGEFKEVSLKDYEGKWVVLFFYPRDFTFICPTEIQEFGEMYPEFQDINCEIVGASTDSEFAHKEWFESDARLKKVTYPIIADTTQELSEMFNVLDEDGSAQRGTFIIDPTGTLKFMLISADSVGRNIKETLRVVKALQTGERCPANWEQGKDTLGKA